MYFLLPNKTALVNIPRAGSTALATAIQALYPPDTRNWIGNVAPQVRVPNSMVLPAGYTGVALVRDPVDRFCSAYALASASQNPAQKVSGSVEDVIAALPTLAKSNILFTPQASLIAATDKVYNFPEQLTECAIVLGITSPVDPANVSDPSSKPTLTNEQTAAVSAFYAADVSLRATAVGSAQQVAAAAFATLPLGKQALWDPVRQSVNSALMVGDTEKAVSIIQTVPEIYDGMEADRDAFLSLFGAQPAAAPSAT